MHVVAAIAGGVVALLVCVLPAVMGGARPIATAPGTWTVLAASLLAYGLTHVALGALLSREGSRARAGLLERDLGHLGASRADPWPWALGVFALVLALGAEVLLPGPQALSVSLGVMALLACGRSRSLLGLPWPPPPRLWESPFPEDLDRRAALPQQAPLGCKRHEYRFRWVHALGEAPFDREFSVTLDLREAVWRQATEQARHEPRSDPRTLLRYVREGGVDEVAVLALRLARIARAEGLDTLGAANLVIAFCNDDLCLPYATDEDTHGEAEYPNYPIETLWDARGDCEDHAILAAALYRRLGFDVVLVWVDTGPRTAHLAVAVHLPYDLPGSYVEAGGRRYWYGEATPAGRHALGEVPAEIRLHGGSLVVLGI